jgi:hypothetical protein
MLYTTVAGGLPAGENGDEVRSWLLDIERELASGTYADLTDSRASSDI